METNTADNKHGEDVKPGRRRQRVVWHLLQFDDFFQVGDQVFQGSQHAGITRQAAVQLLQAEGEEKIRTWATVPWQPLAASAHLQEGDGGGFLLQQVGVSVGPAQGQDERPPLGVERVLELLLLGAGRTRRVIGSRRG